MSYKALKINPGPACTVLTNTYAHINMDMQYKHITTSSFLPSLTHTNTLVKKKNLPCPLTNACCEGLSSPSPSLMLL